MKILMINPPLPNFNENPYPPLGLAYIGAVLDNRGYKVKIIDLAPFGTTINSITDRVLKYAPHIVGITCVAANYHHCVNIARKVKQTHSSCKIIVGGPHVTFISEKVLRDNPWVDVVVRGEGEESMLELVQSFEADTKYLNSIKGITFRTKSRGIYSTGERPFIDDLDAIPYPARDMLPMSKYRELTKYTSIITSRGCSHNCIYCSASAFWKHRIRFRTPLSVCREIEFVRNNYGAEHFKFVDDLFLFDGKRTVELLKLLEKLGIKWVCNTRIDLLNKRLIENAAESGCEKIIFGIESLSPEVQKVIGKNLRINKEDIQETIRLCHENGIQTKLNFILGLPRQTEDDVFDIIDLILKSRPSEIAANSLTPYPGTLLGDDFAHLGVDYDCPHWWEEGTKRVSVSSERLNCDDIVTSSKLINQIAVSAGISAMEGY